MFDIESSVCGKGLGKQIMSGSQQFCCHVLMSLDDTLMTANY